MAKRTHLGASIAIKAALHLLMVFIFIWAVQIKLAKYVPSNNNSKSVTAPQHLIVDRHSAPTAQDTVKSLMGAIQMPVSAAVVRIPVPAFVLTQRVEFGSRPLYEASFARPFLLNLPPPTLL